MNELKKIVAATRMWGGGRASFIVVIFLLAKQLVTFDQALVLILLSVFLEGLESGRRPKSSKRRSTGGTLERRYSSVCQPARHHEQLCGAESLCRFRYPLRFSDRGRSEDSAKIGRAGRSTFPDEWQCRR